MISFMSSVADVPDMCSSINETFVDIRSLVMNFTTEAVTSAVACGCSIAPTGQCETGDVSFIQNGIHVNDQCLFNSAVHENIDVMDNDILAEIGKGNIWRETCELDETECSTCLITSNVTFAEESLITTRKLMYLFRQNSGYGENQYMTGAIAITGEIIAVFANIILLDLLAS